MNNKKEKISEFLNEETENKKNQKQSSNRKLKEKTGLIERLDKVYITEDGRQLLRENY